MDDWAQALSQNFFLLALALFAMGVGLLVWYVALPALKLTKMVQRRYQDRLGPLRGRLRPSEFKFLILSFEGLLADLEARERELRGMAGAVAHEVRNAASVIQNAGELLARERPSPVLSDIRAEARGLEGLSRKFLDLTKPLEPRLELFSARPALERAMRSVKSRAQEKGVELALAEGEECRIYGDKNLYHSAVGNLLGNALQACARGGRVELSLEQDSAGPWLHTRVRDTGEGVPQDFMQRLFEPFATSKGSGVGLGLALSRRFAQAQGGDLVLEKSRPGETVFKLSLKRGVP